MKWKIILPIFTVAIYGAMFGGWYYLKHKPVEPIAQAVVATPEEATPPDMNELWTLVNGYRAEQGLTELARNPYLDKSAQDKCADMVTRDYWSHNTPDGSETWVFIRKYIDGYYKAGENLAYRHDGNSSDILNQWQNSEEHNKNLLDPTYNSVGYAVCQSDNYVSAGFQRIVVQHFAKL